MLDPDHDVAFVRTRHRAVSPGETLIKMLREGWSTARKKRFAVSGRWNSWRAGCLGKGAGNARSAKAEQAPCRDSTVGDQVARHEGHGLPLTQEGWDKYRLARRWPNKGNLSRAQRRQVRNKLCAGFKAERRRQATEQGAALSPVFGRVAVPSVALAGHCGKEGAEFSHPAPIPLFPL